MLLHNRTLYNGASLLRSGFFCVVPDVLVEMPEDIEADRRFKFLWINRDGVFEILLTHVET